MNLWLTGIAFITLFAFSCNTLHNNSSIKESANNTVPAYEIKCHVETKRDFYNFFREGEVLLSHYGIAYHNDEPLSSDNAGCLSHEFTSSGTFLKSERGLFETTIRSSSYPEKPNEDSSVIDHDAGVDSLVDLLNSNLLGLSLYVSRIGDEVAEKLAFVSKQQTKNRMFCEKDIDCKMYMCRLGLVQSDNCYRSNKTVICENLKSSRISCSETEESKNLRTAN